MASVEALHLIKRGGTWFPPGSIIHGLSEAEVEELHGFAIEVEEGAEPESGVLVSALPDRPITNAAPAEVAGDLSPVSDLPDVFDADKGEGGETDEEGGEDGQKDRVGDVRAAIDLLGEDDFTATGRPKVAALTSVLGFKPSVDEVTAALALREAEGQ